MPNFNAVVIVTYGRSGSTLLQGILNTIPGFLIRGENYNVTEGLFEAWKSVHRGVRRHDIPKSGEPSHPWYGIGEIDTDLFAANLGRLVRDMLVPGSDRDSVVCYGFKEIRYPVKAAQFGRYIGFLRLIMPGLAVLINTRSHESVARSGWWAERPSDDVVAEIANREAIFLAYAAKNPDHAFHIRYEDVCANDARLRELHEFLGVPCVRENIEQILAVRHSNVTGKRMRDRKAG